MTSSTTFVDMRLVYNNTMSNSTAMCRYQALKTNSEKKAALSEYQQDKQKQAREEKRQMEKRRREAFTEMLREAGDKVAWDTWSTTSQLISRRLSTSMMHRL